MTTQPFYHLRPNKFIDRSLFVEMLVGLSQIYPISSYRYTGFGSYLFDDFKIIHDTLNITEMISLEKDIIEYQRAKYNCPYRCIEVQNINSSEYITNLVIEEGEHNIFWLDYVSPDDLYTQLCDYSALLNILSPGDVVKITLNATPSSLGGKAEPEKLQEERFEILKKRVGEEFFPPSLTRDDLTTSRYPLTLIKILKKVIMSALEDDPVYSPNFMLPLLPCVYKDGQQMLTFTGIILDSHEMETKIKDALKSYKYITFSWENPCKIEIPALTVREITEMNRMLPSKDAQQQLENSFPFVFSGGKDSLVKSYISFYKYYPNFHNVSL